MIKRSGFEDLRDEDYTLRKKLNSYYQMYHYEYWSEVKDLIKYLKNESIGRPSTYASIISKILDRNYVEITNIEGIEKTVLFGNI